MLVRLDSLEVPNAPADHQQPPLEIAMFCGDCHALPHPECFERDTWYEKIRSGYEFYARSGRSDLVVPVPETVIRFYRENAPETIEFPAAAHVDQAWADRFTTTKLDWRDGSYIVPAIASIRWLELMKPGKRHLLVSDMRDGSVSLVQPDMDPRKTTRTALVRIGSPARFDMCDLDQDGLQDLLVSDLGSLNPYDHALGQVVWLRRVRDSEQFEPQAILQGIGRVSDIVAGDFDGDAAPDLVIAEFGHRRSGGIRLLTNLGENDGDLSFDDSQLDIRPGTVRLLPHDWNADGRLDFAALVSQEYESIELFLNRASDGPAINLRARHFDRWGVWQGADLTFGSVGMTNVDLDRDGDQDLLYVNGDCFDDNHAQRSHGVRWLENTGNQQFTMHHLAELPGAYSAVAADFDNDQDLDIVVVANLPASVQPNALQAADQVSILMLEHTGNGDFQPHVLQRGFPRFPTVECGDFNADGHMDFAVGALLFGNDQPAAGAAPPPRLTVWWNRG